MEEDWNVDDYRAAHESEEHWELRRQFMIANKGKFPRVRVLSLSQVFANVEFLGCKYPTETMELVAELSPGIVEEYRQKRQTRLQRTFVKASAAAEKKSKGDAPLPESTSPDSESPKPPKSWPEIQNRANRYVVPLSQTFVKSGESSSNDKPKYSTSTNLVRKFVPGETSRSGGSGSAAPGLGFKGKVKNVVSNMLEQNSTSTSTNAKYPGNGKPKSVAYAQKGITDLKKLVLVDQPYKSDSPAEILHRSCAMSHFTFSFTPSYGMRGYVCTFTAGTDFSEEGVGTTKEIAKQNAAILALEKLRKMCYTIQIKEPIVGSSEIGKQVFTKEVKDTSITAAPVIDQSNVGNKLLRLMGWTGGGIGKNESGATNVIDVSDSVGRNRLGLGRSTTFTRPKIIEFLKSQIAASGKEDVIFSPEFSTEERAAIHQAAGQLNLKSRSYGKDDKRFLVVSRKISLCDLLEEILTTGETAKYRVIKPGEYEESGPPQ